MIRPDTCDQMSPAGSTNPTRVTMGRAERRDATSQHVSCHPAADRIIELACLALSTSSSRLLGATSSQLVHLARKADRLLVSRRTARLIGGSVRHVRVRALTPRRMARQNAEETNRSTEISCMSRRKARLTHTRTFDNPQVIKRTQRRAGKARPLVHHRTSLVCHRSLIRRAARRDSGTGTHRAETRLRSTPNAAPNGAATLPTSCAPGATSRRTARQRDAPIREPRIMPRRQGAAKMTT